MKLHLLNRTKFDNTSFSVNINDYKHFLKLWHYHPELELVVIIKSSGTSFIGDSIEKFEEGEVVLIGKNLPHKWLNDDVYFLENSKLNAKAVAIHFREEFLGTLFEKAPEMISISKLLQKSSQGIKFIGLEKKLIDKIINLNINDVFKRTIKFIEILYALSNHKQIKVLSSAGFRSPEVSIGNKSLDRMYDYIFDNFKKDISSKDIADILFMNHASFSRFFKRVHKKTFTRYLNEIRTGYACKLILESKYSISSICYESGYNNLSNFNKHFKDIKGMSPTDFIKAHLEKDKAK
ncbi:AraC family transcriptional regulator [Confluentibacter flavum]|uniref:AraC family transcriptional regulator n=1 Tax=Confluentibacter flavum TaxID=1909700 RepID=A0A2N3HI30_9FLAO|nr:AraC family transcriptional regulator [Confluentibacter flavum]PKQ44635.1 AraC family transcriptional regulator [Confluentibacter flavum]